jgi:hypothetical protein
MTVPAACNLARVPRVPARAGHLRTTKEAATREGTDYEAVFNSTYVREDGGWRLALHQQTPV